MFNSSAVGTILVIGTAVIVVALVAYRLLWAASSFAGYFAGAGWLPKRLQRVQHWLHGERR